MTSRQGIFQEDKRVVALDPISVAEEKMRVLLSRLNRVAPEPIFHRAPRNDGGPHVELRGDGFDWVHTERGVELSRQHVTRHELLFVALDGLTAEFAQQAEMRARGNSAYSPWRWMEAHIRLMGHLDPAWGARIAARYDERMTGTALRLEDAIAGLTPIDLSAFGVD